MTAFTPREKLEVIEILREENAKIHEKLYELETKVSILLRRSDAQRVKTGRLEADAISKSLGPYRS